MIDETISPTLRSYPLGTCLWMRQSCACAYVTTATHGNACAYINTTTHGNACAYINTTTHGNARAYINTTTHGNARAKLAGYDWSNEKQRNGVTLGF